MEITLNLVLRGELAEAFMDEWQERLRKDPKLSKTKHARDLLSERLEMLGHEADDPMQWGGYRERSEDSEESPEGTGVAAAV